MKRAFMQTCVPAFLRTVHRGETRRGEARRGEARRRVAGFVVALATLYGPAIAAQQVDVAERPAVLSGETRLRLTNELLSKHVTVHVTRASRAHAIDVISAAVKIPIQYQTQIFDAYRDVVDVDVQSGSLRVALEQALRGTALDVTADASSQLVIVDHAMSGAGLRLGQLQVQVTDSATGHGLNDVVVQIIGTSLRCLTDKDGRCGVTGVVAGEYRVNARRVGYVAAVRHVTVVDGETATVRFIMTPSATVLSGVVTTATGLQKRLEVANDITTLNVDSLLRHTPVRTVTDLLDGRVPGLHVTRSSGDPGSPSRLRIRGIASATQNNDPVIIVDGIRVSGRGSDSSVVNQVAQIPPNPSITPYAPVATVASRLDDLDPASIQSIEVLKGPSASALYGTDAANGVIVIMTTRGQPGRTRWSLNMVHDWTSVPVNGAPIYLGYGHGASNSFSGNCPIVGIIVGLCIPDSVSTFNALNDKFTTNMGTGYNNLGTVSVSGGGSQVQYSVTGSRRQQIGVQKLPDVTRTQLRILGQDPPKSSLRPTGLNSTGITTRLTMQPYKTLDVSLTVDGISQQQWNNVSAVDQQGSEDPRDTLTFAPASYTVQASSSRTTRGVGAVSTSWRPTGWFTANADLGVDHSGRRDDAANQPFLCDTANGCALQQSSTYRGESNVSDDNYTTNLYGVFSREATRGVGLRSSIGGQYRRHMSKGLDVRGSHLAPGSSEIGTATNRLIYTIDGRDATAGWFVEELMSLGESVFLTGAVRQDAGSAFGRDIHAPLYPKAGLSWIVSNQPFLRNNGFIRALKVRVAYGHSGVQPDANAAPATYRTGQAIVNGQVVSTIEYASVGNSRLKPERSAELEGGFDADVFGDRAHIEFTAYNKRSRDALIGRALGPSAGSSSLQQAQNIGAIVNRGIEANVSGRLFDRGGIVWSGTASLTVNRNRVVTLGDGVLPFGDSTARIAVGYPLFGRWIKPVLGYRDINGDGLLAQDEIILGDTTIYAGSTQPKYSVAYSSTVTLPFGLSIDTNLGYDDGVTQIQVTDNGRGFYDPSAPLAEQAASSITRLIGNWQTVSVLRLNSLSMNYNLPLSMTRALRSTSATLSLSGTNLGLWTKYRGNDPTVNSAVIGDKLSDNGAVTPTTRSYALALRLGF